MFNLEKLLKMAGKEEEIAEELFEDFDMGEFLSRTREIKDDDQKNIQNFTALSSKIPNHIILKGLPDIQDFEEGLNIDETTISVVTKLLKTSVKGYLEDIKT